MSITLVTVRTSFEKMLAMRSRALARSGRIGRFRAQSGVAGFGLGADALVARRSSLFALSRSRSTSSAGATSDSGGGWAADNS